MSEQLIRRQKVPKRLIEQNELPDLPSGWGVERLRFLFQESKERNGKRPIGDMLSVSEYRGVVPREYDNQDQKRTEDELENYRVVRPGQLAVNSMWLNHLGLGVSDHLGHVSPAYSVYNISRRLDRRFIHHLMRSEYYLKIYLRYLYGIRPNSFQIKSDDWASIPIIVPDLATQRRIADFLDGETARIDLLIEKKQRLVALLGEKRFAESSWLLTGGLQKERKQKPSGFDWLPSIPAHWTVSKMKNVCQKIIDCKNRTPLEVDGGKFFVVRTSCIKNGTFLKSGGYWTDRSSYEEWTKRGRPEDGDIIFTREAPVGEACIAPRGLPFCLGQRTMIYRPNLETVLPEIIVHTIYSTIGRSFINSKSKGSTVGHLRVPEVYNFPCIVPPMEEQHAILAELSRRVGRFEKVENATHISIVRLKEYRSALITAAVTGQIDVATYAKSGSTDRRLETMQEEMGT